MEQSTLAIIIVLLAIVSFALEKIPVALTAILASLAMAIFGITDYSKAYSDFGSQAAVMVAAMMICGNACFDNGVAQAMGNKITKIGLGKNERLLVTVMTGFAVFLSAFFSNSAVVAMMIPLVASVVSKSGGRCTNKRVLMAVGNGFCGRRLLHPFRFYPAGCCPNHPGNNAGVYAHALFYAGKGRDPAVSDSNHLFRNSWILAGKEIAEI